MHGKVYKLDFIKKWGIRNDPRVKWADDSFFNSMCMELGNMVIFPSPTYCWLYNEGSITRKKDFPQSKSLEDFGNAMKISAEFLHSKGVKKIGHIPKTIELIESKKEFYIKNNSEQQYNELLEFLKQYL